jgi:hypothetical protein
MHRDNFTFLLYDESSTFLRNVDKQLPDYMVSHPERFFVIRLWQCPAFHGCVSSCIMNRSAEHRNKYCLKDVVTFPVHYVDVPLHQRTSLCGQVGVTCFTFSLWLTVGISSVLGWSYRVYVENIADISEAHAAPIFSVEECRMGEFLCISFFRKATGEGEVGLVACLGQQNQWTEKVAQVQNRPF